MIKTIEDRVEVVPINIKAARFYHPELDGLRFLAFLLVFGHNYFLAYLSAFTTPGHGGVMAKNETMKSIKSILGGWAISSLDVRPPEHAMTFRRHSDDYFHTA